MNFFYLLLLLRSAAEKKIEYTVGNVQHLKNPITNRNVKLITHFNLTFNWATCCARELYSG